MFRARRVSAIERGMICYFAATVGGFRVDGLQLMRTERSGLVVLPPAFAGERTQGLRAVTIIDSALQAALVGAAREAYAALFGDIEPVRYVPFSEREGR